MSSVYNLDPETSGKVLFRSSFGDIEIELWVTQIPNATKIFIQDCLDNIYANTTFHRIIPNFLIQGGNVPGYDEPEELEPQDHEDARPSRRKVETHSRLKFNKRGVVAMAGINKQFFITLASAPELQGKHTIIGKVVGDSLFNVLKIGESELLDEDSGAPINPCVIKRTSVILNPFPDLVARAPKRALEEDDKLFKKAKKKKTVKNVNLLSFDMDEDADQELVVAPRIKSSHDLLKDKKLSSRTVLESGPKSGGSAEIRQTKIITKRVVEEETTVPATTVATNSAATNATHSISSKVVSAEEDDELERRQKLEEQYAALKQQLLTSQEQGSSVESDAGGSSQGRKLLTARKEKYVKKLKGSNPTGDKRIRESKTLDKLAAFEQALRTKSKPKRRNVPQEEEPAEEDEDWMSHELKFVKRPQDYGVPQDE